MWSPGHLVEPVAPKLLAPDRRHVGFANFDLFKAGKKLATIVKQIDLPAIQFALQRMAPPTVALRSTIKPDPLYGKEDGDALPPFVLRIDPCRHLKTAVEQPGVQQMANDCANRLRKGEMGEGFHRGLILQPP